LNALITFGLPGSGKSTWISNNVHSHELVVSADEIKREFDGYSDENHSEFYKLAVDIAEQRVYNLVALKQLIVFDTGSINSNYSVRILKHLKKLGYAINLVIFNTPIEVCIERDRDRPQSVGESVIRAKAEKAPSALYNLIQLLTSEDSISIV
jgi:predicted kinase